MDDLSWQLLQPLFQSREMAKPALLEQSLWKGSPKLPAASSLQHQAQQQGGFFTAREDGQGWEEGGKGPVWGFFFLLSLPKCPQ